MAVKNFSFKCWNFIFKPLHELQWLGLATVLGLPRSRFMRVYLLYWLWNFRKRVIKSNRAASADGLEGEFTPKSRKASVFGSLERMFNMLTPKKQNKASSDGPRKVKVSSYIFTSSLIKMISISWFFWNFCLERPSKNIYKTKKKK